MNLRQKCKKQKQYIERLERMSLPVNKIVYTQESLEHLRIKRNMVIDRGAPNDSKDYFKSLTINQIAHDIATPLGEYVEFNDEEGYATLDVWVRRKGDSQFKTFTELIANGTKEEYESLKNILCKHYNKPMLKEDIK